MLQNGEFQVYTPDKNNTYIENGMLHIAPVSYPHSVWDIFLLNRMLLRLFGEKQSMHDMNNLESLNLLLQSYCTCSIEKVVLQVQQLLLFKKMELLQGV